MSEPGARAGGATGDGAPEVVCAFASAARGRPPAVSWADRHARHTGATLLLLVDPVRDARERGRRRAGMLARVAGTVGTLLGPREGETLAERLVRASAGAQLLVVPQTLRGVDDLVGAAYEPVVVVPDDHARSDGPVVAAVAPWTATTVMAAAVAAAAERRARLVLLRALAPSPFRTSSAADAARAWETERQSCEDDIAIWRFAYPEVEICVRLTDGDPADVLEELSRDAQLLVLGRSRRGRLLDALAATPVSRVTRHARCPVLVVPPPGPPRRTWWPAPRWETPA